MTADKPFREVTTNKSQKCEDTNITNITNIANIHMYTRVHIAQKNFFIVELRKNNKQRKKEKMKTKKGLFSKMATASQAIFLTIYDTLIYFYEIIVPVLMLSSVFAA